MQAFVAEDIKARLGDGDAYRRLAKVWRERIIVEGPPSKSQIGVVSTSDGKVWQVYAVAPVLRDGLFLVRSLIDLADNDAPLLFAPALLVALHEQTICWVDVVNARGLFSPMEQSWRCARFLSRAFQVSIVAVGPRGD